MRGEQSIYAVSLVPDTWHILGAQKMAVLFSFSDTYVFAALAESELKAWKECLIFYLFSANGLSVVHQVFCLSGLVS